MNLLTEDLVHLLLREQQISKNNQCLQEKLNKSLSQDETPAIGLDVSTVNFFFLIIHSNGLEFFFEISLLDNRVYNIYKNIIQFF